MPLHTIAASFKDDAGSVPLSATTYVVAEEVNALIPVPAGSVDVEKDIEFLFGKVNDYCLAVGSQSAAQALTGTYSEPAAGAITVKTNDATSPVPAAFTIQAKQPLVFAGALAGTANKFTANVLKFFLSNPGSVDLMLIVKIGLNA